MRHPVAARWLAAAMVVVALGPAAAAGEVASRTAAPTRVAVATVRLQDGAAAWVAVSVATLWRSPNAPRDVDAPALARPARIDQWLADLTLAERRGLNGLADTQVLLGDRVTVVRLLPSWAKVVVPSQPTPLDARGYPGWVPRRQLTAVRPVRAPLTATVTRRTAWLRTDDPAATNVLRVSFGTRFPVAGTTPAFVRVHLPAGRVLRIAKTAVVRHGSTAAALAPTRAGLVGSATSFVGLAYLWAGASGFGVDCSGLTWLTYRVHGVRIPRDASAQWAAGRRVTGPQRGDLMFYGAPVRHVSMYAGSGTMVHSPGTGETVEVIATSRPAYAAAYVGARRLLP